MKVSNVAEMIEGYSEDRYLMREKNDCTVVALAAALKMPYKTAHKVAEKYGRKRRQGMYNQQVEEMLGEMPGLRSLTSEETSTYYNSTRKVRANKLSTFAGRYPKGTYIVRVRGHVVAVEDGVVLERGKPRNWHVRQAWEVTGRCRADELPVTAG